MGSPLETNQLGQRVLRAWKDYDVCPDFEEQMSALVGCVTAIEETLATKPFGNDEPKLKSALENLERVLP
jgi:hypothetical protein